MASGLVIREIVVRRSAALSKSRETEIDRTLADAETRRVSREEDAAGRYATAMKLVGEGDAPGPAKLKVAEHFGRYIEDMHKAIPDQRAKPGTAREMFPRPDMVRYFSETLTEPATAETIGHHLTEYAKLLAEDLLDPADERTFTEARKRLDTVEQIGGALLDGAAVSGESSTSQAQAMVRKVSNSIENHLAGRIVQLSSLKWPGEVPPADPEEAIIWWFEKQNRMDPIQSIYNKAVDESERYTDNEHWAG